MLRLMSARILLNEAPRRLDPHGDPWPLCLSELREPPEQLFAAGELPPLAHAVAIVGTRHASEDARQFTRQLARELAGAGAVIVSGEASTSLALGLTTPGVELALNTTGLPLRDWPETSAESSFSPTAWPSVH